MSLYIKANIRNELSKEWAKKPKIRLNTKVIKQIAPILASFVFSPLIVFEIKHIIIIKIGISNKISQKTASFFGEIYSIYIYIYF